MKKHTKVYMKHFNYGIDDFIGCTVCNARAVDIHHIERRGIGGSKNKDYIENLVALCRKCHDKAESSRSFNNTVRIKHLNKVLYKLKEGM